MKDVRLQPLVLENLEMVLRWRNSEHVRRNMYTSHEISKEEHLNWFSTLNGDVARRYFVCYINSSPVGVVGFTQIDPQSKTASWAFYAAIDAPRGSGSIMEYYALDYAFSVLDLEVLECEVISFNKPVIRLHQKFGFKVEGELKGRHKVDGELFDVILLAINSDCWREQKEAMKNKLRL